jgi:hypothetical protein
MAVKSRMPDYRAKALTKSTGDKGEVGAAWVNPDGSISFVLDPYITLTQNGRDLLVTLFPESGGKKVKSKTKHKPGYYDDDYER